MEPKIILFKQTLINHCQFNVKNVKMMTQKVENELHRKFQLMLLSYFNQLYSLKD
jgi:hypothetical protein